MQFQPGHPGGPGRPKGSKNKKPKKLKSMLMNALEKVGGERYFVKIAEQDPQLFVALISKILPSELNVTVDDGTVATRILDARKRLNMINREAEIEVTGALKQLEYKPEKVTNG